MSSFTSKAYSRGTPVYAFDDWTNISAASHAMSQLLPGRLPGAVAHGPDAAARSDAPADVQKNGPTTPSSGALERELHFARQALSADWWPRGVGLLVDEGGTRHELEPAGGVTSWMQLERRPDGWSSAGSSQVFPVAAAERLPGAAFLCQLADEVRSHAHGLGSRALSRLPTDGQDLLHALKALGPDLAGRCHCRSIPRPIAHGFSPGESLCREVRIAASGGANVASIQGEVASRLGASLAQRFDWTRPLALERQPFLSMAQRLTDLGARDAAWSLRVGEQGGDVMLMLHQGEQETCLGTVLKAGAHLQGAAVFRPNGSDDLRKVWESAGDRFNGARNAVGRFLLPAHMVVPPDGKPLAGLDLDGRVVVQAHGGILPLPGRLPFTVSVGGKSPDRLARELIDEGLPEAFKGTIYLDACYSGAGPGVVGDYAHRLQRALAARGRPKLTVAGHPGTTRDVHQRVETVPAQLARRPGTVISASRALIRNFEREGARAPSGEDKAMYARLAQRERTYIQEVQRFAQAPGSSGKAGSPLAWAKRAWTGLKGLFGRNHGNSDTGQETRQFDQAKVRNLWGHIGPATPTRIDKDARR